MIRKCKDFLQFLKDIYGNRELLISLSLNDLKMRFAASLLGTVWAFILPAVTILVFWFVFEIGLKNPPVDDMPFIIWFLPAYIPWMYFSDVLGAIPGSLYEYSYLIKKVRFRTSIIPLVKLLSAIYIHVFFMAVLIVINLAYGRGMRTDYLQTVYYSAALTVMLTGLAWLLSSLAVFFKDVMQVVNVVLQIGFWMTPIFWNINNLSPKLQIIFHLNPMYYITQGYRDSVVYGIPFWARPNATLYFWMVTAALFTVGAMIFQKLRPHFADVL